MSRFLCCCVLLLASPALAQPHITDCEPNGEIDVQITQDLLVDRRYDWWCDAHIWNGAEVRIVAGGSIYGAPRFDDDSYLVLEEGGYIEVMNTESGYPWGYISGGSSRELNLIGVEHQSYISGGRHAVVSGLNLSVSGGSIGRLIP